MCGIIGYTGELQAVPLLLEGLETLSYRGYDSAGMALHLGSRLCQLKAGGRLEALRHLVEGQSLDSGCGIGHTRWATHGAPDAVNAHPHGTESVMLVHNGIIENERLLRKRLTEQGYTFLSETDSEVAAKWIDSCYQRLRDPVAAILKAVEAMEGSYAFGLLFKEAPDTVYAIRRGSPLIIASSEHGSLLASDIPAVLPYTRSCCVLENGELAVLAPKEIRLYGGNREKPVYEHIDWDFQSPEKEQFAHYMVKEIHEEPEVVRRTMESVSQQESVLRGFTDCQRIHIVACGTAMHAGEMGGLWMEQEVGLPVRTMIASEFRYAMPSLSREDLVILISQSGETADTLAAMRQAQAVGARTLTIVNAVGSTMAREAEQVLYTQAGQEIAVASTKAYMAQLTVLYMLSAYMAVERGRMSEDTLEERRRMMRGQLPRCLEAVWTQRGILAQMAAQLRNVQNLFYIGRGTDYFLCKEASLKLKEISYIHSEAYPAGELKHGTISLIHEETPVIAIMTDPRLYDKMESNIREVLSRGARVMLIGGEKDTVSAVRDRLQLSGCPQELKPFAVAMAVQLLAYETAVCRGCDVDKPRNLAKSVTVE